MVCSVKQPYLVYRAGVEVVYMAVLKTFWREVMVHLFLIIQSSPWCVTR